MRFDLTNFISGLAGTFVGGIVVWITTVVKAKRTRDGYSLKQERKSSNPSILLGVAFVIGILIALYLLIKGRHP
jgi:uncharacterized membrane protein (UPF0136 family)